MLARSYSRRLGSCPAKFDAKRFSVSSELTPAQAEHGQLLVEAVDPDDINGDELFMIVSEVEARALKAELDRYFDAERIEMTPHSGGDD